MFTGILGYAGSRRSALRGCRNLVNDKYFGLNVLLLLP